jgi:hypothetical protein
MKRKHRKKIEVRVIAVYKSTAVRTNKWADTDPTAVTTLTVTHL